MLGLDILFMVGKKSRFGSGKISNMFDFSHSPNRQLPTLTECLGLSNFCLRLSGIHKEFKTDLKLSQGLNLRLVGSGLKFCKEDLNMLGLDILFMVGKKSRFGSGKISNMFDFSHSPNRQLPTLTECLGLSKFLKPTPKNP